ncbi:hypothetical protein, partial [Caballeronia sp. BR00000012568055]|uniref:hypothetical protein n=1 Tax=Caballeronia sp. BR00000012568055 TaxID=2918761 RepID=UPI0023F66DD3
SVIKRYFPYRLMTSAHGKSDRLDNSDCLARKSPHLPNFVTSPTAAKNQGKNTAHTTHTAIASLST